MDTGPFDIVGLRAAYAAGLSPRDAIAAVYRRVAAVDDPGIFIHLATETEALTLADALPAWDDAADLPLWGMPFAVKDNIDVAGMPTTAGCPSFAYTASADAACVARLRAAGAIPIGKTNLDQFATGLVGMRSPYEPPRNALDPDLIPGGSSSGSAVAVAHGIVPFALGTDTAGSGRVPAALNNIVGLKPSLGTISARGMLPACRTLDTVSIFALTVRDAHTVFRIAAEYDPADPYSRNLPVRTPSGAVAGVRLGVPKREDRSFFGDTAQQAAFERDLSRLAALGARIEEIPFDPFQAVAALLYEGPWIAERYAAIADVMRDSPEVVHPTTRAVIERADAFDAVDTFKAIYRLAALKREIQALCATVDGLCVPSIPTVFSRAELAADPIGPNNRLGTYTNFVNLLDMCGMAVPTAPRSDGRPGGVTFLAPAGQDHGIAGLAASFHAHAGPSCGATGLVVPPGFDDAPAPRAGEVAVVAVGAHMRDLPLNDELTGRGARFLRQTRTAACYRLYALPGDPPKRPGLVRDDSGAAIDVEVWAMPDHALGGFLAGIPTPLGLGTVFLEDGSSAIGFLCEAIAVHNALDITATGGWRAYLAGLAKVG